MPSSGITGATFSPPPALPSPGPPSPPSSSAAEVGKPDAPDACGFAFAPPATGSVCSDCRQPIPPHFPLFAIDSHFTQTYHLSHTNHVLDRRAWEVLLSPCEDGANEKQREHRS